MSDPLWLNFERDITALHSQFGEASHNVEIKGKSGATHQIDAVLKKQVGIYSHTTIVSCKCWKSPVKKEQVMTWRETVEDCGVNAGAIFSVKGFQSGAITYAKYHNIYLFSIKTLTDKDLDGYIKQVNVHIMPMKTQIIKVVPCLKGDESDSGKTINAEIQVKDASIFNEEKIVFGNFIEDINRAVAEDRTYAGNPQWDIELNYPEKNYLLIQGKFYLLQSATITVQSCQMPKSEIVIDFAKEYPYHLIKHTENKIYPISKDGIIKVSDKQQDELGC